MTASSSVLVGGRYRPTEQIAVGGMGEIWRGEDTVLGRSVVIKMLRPDYAGDPGFRERFRAEARHAAVLTQPNITQVFDFVDDDAQAPGIVMEYVAGESLATMLERQAPLTVDQTWSIIGQTAAALAAAHRVGIVHRDIKPGNILICSDGVVKVTDFGIARAFDDAGATQPGLVLGTAHYLAPEQLAGEKATPASDMYSLGVVGYQCLTGRLPFQGDVAEVLRGHQVEEPPPLPAGSPAALADLILALLAKDPAARPSDAEAIAAQAQRMASRNAHGDVLPEERPAEPYPAAPEPVAAGPTTADPVTSILTVDRSASLPAQATPRDWRQLARERHTAIAVGGLVLALLAATLFFNHLLSSGPAPAHNAAKPGKPAATGGASPAASAAPVQGATVVGGGDHPEELGFVTDSSPSTAWYTEHYATAAFGSLKQGVGLRLSVGGSAPVKMVVIRFAVPGIAAKLYAGNNPGGKALASTTSAPRVWRVTLPSAIQSHSWVIWITRLAPDSGGYRAGVAQVRFLT